MSNRFEAAPEYNQGKTDFRLGAKSVHNPFATGDNPRPFPAWLWSCGWADALREKIDETV